MKTKTKIKKSKQLAHLARQLAEFGYEGILAYFSARDLLPTATLFRKALRRKSAPARNLKSACRMLEKLGPGYVELGRILASRGDILPKQYRTALLAARHSPKQPFRSDLEQWIARQSKESIVDACAHIDWEPYRMNLLGHTFRGVLRDGRRVLITVQYPKELYAFQKNLETMHRFVRLYIENTAADHKDSGPWEDIWRELVDRANCLRDLTHAAARMEMLAAQFETHKKASVPEVLWEYTNRHVLVQEYEKLPTLADVAEGRVSGVSVQYVARYLAEAMVSGYCGGVFFLRPRLGDIQLGSSNRLTITNSMETGMLAPGNRPVFVGMLYALSQKRADVAAKLLLHAHYRMQRKKDPHESGLVWMDSGTATPAEALWELLEQCWQGNIAVPLGITMAAESLYYLEELLAKLHPKADLHDLFAGAVKKYAKDIFDISKNASVEAVVKAALGAS